MNNYSSMPTICHRQTHPLIKLEKCSEMIKSFLFHREMASIIVTKPEMLYQNPNIWFPGIASLLSWLAACWSKQLCLLPSCTGCSIKPPFTFPFPLPELTFGNFNVQSCPDQSHKSGGEVDGHILSYWHVHQDQPLCEREKRNSRPKKKKKKSKDTLVRRGEKFRGQMHRQKRRARIPHPLAQPCSPASHWRLIWCYFF